MERPAGCAGMQGVQGVRAGRGYLPGRIITQYLLGGALHQRLAGLEAAALQGLGWEERKQTRGQSGLGARAATGVGNLGARAWG